MPVVLKSSAKLFLLLSILLVSCSPGKGDIAVDTALPTITQPIDAPVLTEPPAPPLPSLLPLQATQPAVPPTSPALRQPTNPPTSRPPTPRYRLPAVRMVSNSSPTSPSPMAACSGAVPRSTNAGRSRTQAPAAGTIATNSSRCWVPIWDFPMSRPSTRRAAAQPRSSACCSPPRSSRVSIPAPGRRSLLQGIYLAM